MLELPIAHGEGKFVPADDEVRQALWANDQVALVYVKPDGSAANGQTPHNPNGSIDDIAGVCDASGLVFGLMPHPERHVTPLQHPAWARMRAFALPSFSEGYVRLNVRGREASGMIDPADYDKVCADVSADIMRLTDARTGKAAAKRVVRTRVGPDGPAVDGERPSDADLIVVWDGVPIDVVDHPTAGRIGPVPFKRSGSHVHRGFLMAAGPGVGEGARLPEAHALDIPPTILTLLGAPIPAHFDGHPLALTTDAPALAVAG